MVVRDDIAKLWISVGVNIFPAKSDLGVRWQAERDTALVYHAQVSPTKAPSAASLCRRTPNFRSMRPSWKNEITIALESFSL